MRYYFILSLSLLWLNSTAQQNIQRNYFQNIDRQLLYTTVLLEVWTDSKSSPRQGTGFWYRFEVAENTPITVIVTNLHVVKNAAVVITKLNLTEKNGLGHSSEKVKVDLLKLSSIIKHPNKSIDLCIIPVTPLLKALNQDGKSVFYKCITEEMIPTIWNEIFPGAEVKIIGHPKGIIDKFHLTPIYRTGFIATDPLTKFNGEPYFLIDSPSFPGASGSLVWEYRARKLIGILTGTMKNKSLDLGVVLKSDFLHDFKPILKERL